MAHAAYLVSQYTAAVGLTACAPIDDAPRGRDDAHAVGAGPPGDGTADAAARAGDAAVLR